MAEAEETEEELEGSTSNGQARIPGLGEQLSWALQSHKGLIEIR